MIIVRSQWAHYIFSRTIVQELVVLVVSAFGEVKIWSDVNVNNLLNHNMCSNIAAKKKSPTYDVSRSGNASSSPFKHNTFVAAGPNLAQPKNTHFNSKHRGFLPRWIWWIIDVVFCNILGIQDFQTQHVDWCCTNFAAWSPQYAWRITISQSSLVCLTFRLRGIWKSFNLYYSRNTIPNTWLQWFMMYHYVSFNYNIL
jgi:hypothetical protein